MAEILQGDVNVPGIGKTKKWAVYGVGGVAVGYVAYRWWVVSREGPEPGEDGLYATPDLSESGLSTTGGAYNPGGNTGSVVTDATNPNAINTNSQWTNEAVNLLGGSGYDPSVVYAALGEFLARRALDKTEATIVRSALAAAGQPPIGGPYTVIEEASSGTGTLKAPTNLRSGGVPTASSIRLQWDAVDGASGYRVYRGTGENIGHSADTAFTVTGLKSDTTYTFTVAAVGSTGKVGGRSNAYKAGTSAVKLARPSGLKASAITRTSFRVTCKSVPGAQYYRWYINGRAAGASDTPTRQFAGLKTGTSYRITVSADTTNQLPGPQSSALTVKTKR